DRGYPTMRIGTFLCEVLAHPKDDPDALFLLVLPSHIYLNLLSPRGLAWPGANSIPLDRRAGAPPPSPSLKGQGPAAP
ncbi:MAG: hypothetical protein ABSF61_01380, partial [Anaerolineales bacterium]